MVCQRIEHDAREVSDEPIVLVTEGLSVIAAQEYRQRFAERVQRIIAIQPRYTLPLAQRLSLRKTPYIATLAKSNHRSDDESSVVQIKPEDTQYPAQTAAAVYRVMMK